MAPKREAAGSNPAWRAKKPRKQALFRGFSFSISLILANEYIRLALFVNCIIACALNVMKSIKAFLKQDYAVGITVILLEQMGRSWHEAARASSQGECAGIPVHIVWKLPHGKSRYQGKQQDKGEGGIEDAAHQDNHEYAARGSAKKQVIHT